VGRYAVFIDAGYLKHSGARALRRKAHQLTLQARPIVQWASGLAGELKSSDGLLRVYWYDGEFDTGHPEYQQQRRYFNAIEDVPGIQLRLGYVEFADKLTEVGGTGQLREGRRRLSARTACLRPLTCAPG